MKYEITITDKTCGIVNTDSEQAVELAIAAYYTDYEITKLIIKEDNHVIFAGRRKND